MEDTIVSYKNESNGYAYKCIYKIIRNVALI